MRWWLFGMQGVTLSLLSPISKAPSDVLLHLRASWALRAATCPLCPLPLLGMAPTYRLRLVVMVEVTNGSSPFPWGPVVPEGQLQGCQPPASTSFPLPGAGGALAATN